MVSLVYIFYPYISLIPAGTPSADGSSHILSGAYNDGTPWDSDQELFMVDGKTMTLKAAGITETYNRLTGGIPEEVTASCVTIVKSPYVY